MIYLLRALLFLATAPLGFTVVLRFRYLKNLLWSFMGMLASMEMLLIGAEASFRFSVWIAIACLLGLIVLTYLLDNLPALQNPADRGSAEESVELVAEMK